MRRKLALVVLRIGEVTYNSLVTHIPSHAVRKSFLRLLGARLGRRAYVLRGTTVLCAHLLRIGERTNIGFRCLLDARGGLTIGDRVVIASDTHIIAGTHSLTEPGFPAALLPVTIDDYAWIASRALILPDVTIGRGAVVAAGACVTRDVEACSIVGGVPAKEIGRRDGSLLDYDPSWFPLLY